MAHRSVITAEHAEIHISVCDLALDVTPEGGGFDHQVTTPEGRLAVHAATATNS